VKREWLEARTLEEVIIEGVDILDRIRKSKAVDDEVVKIVEEMKSPKKQRMERRGWADTKERKGVCAEG